MSTRWERLAGDTSVFAVKISFESDPDDGEAASPEMSASWGSLELWVEGLNITAHASSGKTIDSVQWYLLPFLEWIANNWNPLFHETRLPVSTEGDNAAISLDKTRFPPRLLTEERAEKWDEEWAQWWSRHSSHACREGGIFPELFIRRWRDQIELSWQETSIAGAGKDLRFLAPVGQVRLDPIAVARPLYDVTREAASYLQQSLQTSPRLQNLVSLLQTIPVENDDRLAWMAGLGRTAESVRSGWRNAVDRIRRFSTQLNTATDELVSCPSSNGLVLEGSCHASLLFGSVSPDIDAADVMALAKAMISAHKPQASARIYEYQREESVLTGPKAWQQGYDLAEQTRDLLQLSEAKAPDLDEVLSQLDIKVRAIRLRDRSIRAIALAGPGYEPTVLYNSSVNANKDLRRRRFAIAHELCHLLVDRDHGTRLAIASGPWAPRDLERRANAFAAAFLMPFGAVQQAVGELKFPLASPEGVAQVADALDTGALATLEHLHNLGFLDEGERDQIREDMTRRR